MEKICFVCTGNICRSPMAEGIFNALAEKYNLPIRAESAGTGVPLGSRASENSVLAVKEFGVDLSEHHSTPIYLQDCDTYKRFYVMELHHKSALLEMGISEDMVTVLNEESGGISDPYGCDLKRYILCRNEILRAIKDEFYKNKRIKIGNMIL